NLLTGVSPALIGTGASWRAYYTLDGTPGAVPAIGDSGLNNAIDGTLNFATTAGSGTALYSSPLVWVPSVQPDPAESYVAMSGKCVVMFLETIVGGTRVSPSLIQSI